MTADVALEPVKLALDQTGRKYQHDKLNHIQASCPGPNHRRGDRNYSLSIDYDPTKRKVLMWCHVCGPVGDMDAVRDALGLSIADLSEESCDNSSRSRTRSQPKSPPSSQNSELKCGGTLEEHGWPSIGKPDKPARGETWFSREWDRGFPIAWKVRRACVRCGDRTFLWLRTDDRGNVTWGKPDGVMPLGGLHDLLDAIHSGEPVHAYITEGDSDAQAVRKAGAIAVTAGGVNDWVPEHFDQLDGVARVTICSDADTPGRKHARRVRAELDKRGILCRVVEPLEGKDVREHLEVGLSLGDLVPWPPTDHPLPDQPDARPEDGLQRQLVLTRASDIQPQCVHWLWQGRLALGTLALLAGREGIGKSILIYTVAAMITQGMLPGKFYGVPKSVLVAATEDSWAQTIVPRLIAAGADRTRVIRVEVLTSDLVHVELSLPADLPAVRTAAQKLDPVLLILDPLTSRLSDKLDTHKDAEVRQALEPTVRMADDAGIAVWGIIHHNKTATADPLQAVMASKAFTAVARSVHTVMVDPDDETERRRLFGTPKNNLGRVDLPTLSFVIDSYQVPTVEGPTEVGQLRWGEDSKVSIFEAMRRASEDADKRSAAADAAEWLEAYLKSKGGRAESKPVKAAADEANVSDWSLRRARERLRVHVEREHSFDEPKTWWWLPDAWEVAEGAEFTDSAGRGGPGESLTTNTTTTNGEITNSREGRENNTSQIPAPARVGRGGPECPRVDQHERGTRSPVAAASEAETCQSPYTWRVCKNQACHIQAGCAVKTGDGP